MKSILSQLAQSNYGHSFKWDTQCALHRIRLLWTEWSHDKSILGNVMLNKVKEASLFWDTSELSIANTFWDSFGPKSSKQHFPVLFILFSEQFVGVFQGTNASRIHLQKKPVITLRYLTSNLNFRVLTVCQALLQVFYRYQYIEFPFYK